MVLDGGALNEERLGQTIRARLARVPALLVGSRRLLPRTTRYGARLAVRRIPLRFPAPAGDLLKGAHAIALQFFPRILLALLMDPIT